VLRFDSFLFLLVPRREYSVLGASFRAKVSFYIIEIVPTALREVKWSLPEGLVVAEKPATLDDSLVGAIIFMRWVKYGWLVGKISEKFTTATPRLFNKFNYRIKWFDGWENHMLILDNYSSGLSAPYKSWCLLEKVAEEA